MSCYQNKGRWIKVKAAKLLAVALSCIMFSGTAGTVSAADIEKGSSKRTEAAFLLKDGTSTVKLKGSSEQFCLLETEKEGNYKITLSGNKGTEATFNYLSDSIDGDSNEYRAFDVKVGTSKGKKASNVKLSAKKKWVNIRIEEGENLFIRLRNTAKERAACSITVKHVETNKYRTDIPYEKGELASEDVENDNSGAVLLSEDSEILPTLYPGEYSCKYGPDAACYYVALGAEKAGKYVLCLSGLKSELGDNFIMKYSISRNGANIPIENLEEVDMPAGVSGEAGETEMYELRLATQGVMSYTGAYTSASIQLDMAEGEELVLKVQNEAQGKIEGMWYTFKTELKQVL